MNDTLPEIEKVYRELLMARSGKERFRMGLEMFEVARAMMLAGLKDENGDAGHGAVLLRLYGNDFTMEEQQRILNRIGASRE